SVRSSSARSTSTRAGCSLTALPAPQFRTRSRRYSPSVRAAIRSFSRRRSAIFSSVGRFVARTTASSSRPGSRLSKFLRSSTRRYRHGSTGSSRRHATCSGSQPSSAGRSPHRCSSASDRASPWDLLCRNCSASSSSWRSDVARHLRQAGDAARGLNANDEALSHYREALRFLDRLGEEERARRTLLKIALTHHLGFDFEAASATFEEAFARSAPAGARLEASERLDTTSVHPEAFVPGLGYTAPAWFFIQP